MTELSVTHTSKVTEDQIDHLGHMNVRYYAVNATRATRALLEAIGWDGRYATDDVYTRHHREQLEGTPLEVRSGVLTVDSDQIRFHHELRATDTEVLAATFVHRVVAVGTDGAPTTFADDVVTAAQDRLVMWPDYAATRTIDLDADLLAGIPPLDVAIERGLAMRKPRKVSAEECRADGSYDTTFAAALTWGGEPLEGDARGDIPHVTDAGEKMAWAAMENRCVTKAWPRLGDRIQSFGAPVEVFDKVTHRVQWVYDLDSGILLNAFEVVSLAFDIGARRPMSIPENFRRHDLAALQPDLIPRPR